MILKRCGIAIVLDEKKFKLKLPIKPEARKKKDMRSFVFDPVYLSKLKDPVYLMYRDVGSLNPTFKKLESKFGVRYDLTLIRNGLMGPEYVRTAGHHHPKNYSEIYEVVCGKAAFILQSKDLKKMAVVIAKEGETVVIPPKFGHQTVNMGKCPLLVGNLVYNGFKSDYSVYKKKHGGAFYLNQYAGPWIMINANYGIPRAKFPKIKKMNGRRMGPLDKLFLKNPQKIARFLKGMTKPI
jgi:oxalate decarboxylase/phosphoglucose isomerase-like protein (cupin superfamily)